MTDEQLTELNSILDWNAFVLDAKGRRFGQPAGPGKRTGAQPIPDHRISWLNERVGLGKKRVLEVGCFEGIHTVALLKWGAEVTAVDSRTENVVKTVVRTAMFGYAPRCLLRDVEADGLPPDEIEVVVHIGVLYHLADPVKHLLELGSTTASSLLLDTHFALPHEAVSTYKSEGYQVPFKDHDEGRIPNVFAGMSPRSRWLLMDDLQELLRAGGFRKVEIVETREERNGPRVCLFAER